MINEARSRQIKKFIQMNCLQAMEDFPVETARAFIYVFESQGWSLDSIDNQDFVDYFREKRSFSDNENKWLDNNNEISPEWNKVKYKTLKDVGLKIRMKVKGSKLLVSDLSINYQSVSKIKPIDLNRSIKEAFGDLVNIANDIGDAIIDGLASGKGMWDIDVRDTLGDKYKSKQEKDLKKKLEPLRTYFNKINYKFKINKNYGVYMATLKPTELDGIRGVNNGMYYPHQFLEYSKKLPFIIKRFNQVGLWLVGYGTNTDNAAWLEFRNVSPDTTSGKHMGTDSETGEIKSRQRGKENLKYHSFRDEQQLYIDRITNWAKTMSQDKEVHERYYETIKKLFTELQEED